MIHKVRKRFKIGSARKWRSLSLVCFVALAGASAAEVGDSAWTTSLPEWIWPGDDRHGAGAATFRRVFSLEEEPESARLRVTADFAAVRIEVNGRHAGEIEAYDPPTEIDLRPFLATGKNAIVLAAEGVPGPSAIAASVAIGGDEEDSAGWTVATSEDWKIQGGREAVSFGKIDPRRWAPNRLPEISPFAEYNQWKEAVPGSEERLSPLPPGFEIEKLHAAREDEGSWVSLAIDPEGRPVVGREDRGLLRLTLPEANAGAAGEKVAVEQVEDSLEECRGLVFVDGDLYANANRSKGLYRLRDSDGDGFFEESELLQATGGSFGHGRNDLALGPNGRIHAIQGDVVDVPEDAQRLTVPEPGAPRELGHWASISAEAGGCGGSGRANGSGNGSSEVGEDGGGEWRIHARGLRNPYGIDFHPDGEAFTYEADNEGDVGLPFYRPTRINHLVSGGNYGWHQDRGNTRSLPVHAPDTLPTTFDVGRGSPTAVKFATGSGFPPRFREALLALDWAYGRILAVHLTPRGASYYGSGEVLVEGRPLNVTDLAFDAEGAMLFVTGGRKTQSALYRLRYTGEIPPASGPSAQAEARSAHSALARERRRQLEAEHGRTDAPVPEFVWSALGDPDPWIRHAARIALESRDPAEWRDRALAGEAAGGDLGRLTALLALARAGRPADRGEVIARLVGLDAAAWGRSEQLLALRGYELGLESGQIPGPEAPLFAKVRDQVVSWLESPSDPVRRETVEILVALGWPGAVPAGLRLQSSASGQPESLHYLEALSEARVGWTSERRDRYFRILASAKRTSSGDRFMDGFFQAVEKEALAGVADSAGRKKFARILAGDEDREEGGGGKGDEASAASLANRKKVKAWGPDDFQDIFNTSLEGRDPERGREVFDAALCSRCHTVRGRGRPVGPDLTRVASRFTRRDLLEAILQPSKVIAEVHRNTLLRLQDGELVQGRIVHDDFRKSLVSVSVNPFRPDELVEIPKSEILSHEASPVSPMPPSLLDTFQREEILDMIAWLEGDGSASAGAP